MYDIKKFIAIDIEGDGLDKSINQKIFPDGCHIDPNTRIWCATIAIRSVATGAINTRTYVTKLNGTRAVIGPNGRMAGMTTAEHYKETTIPKQMETIFGSHEVIECPNEQVLLTRLLSEINYLTCNLRNYIWIKGYGEYKYDYMAIINSLDRLFKTDPRYDDKLKELINSVFGAYIYNATTEFPRITVDWPGTTEQISAGRFKDNQTYMNTGIRHNIEDTVQLLNMVERYAKQSNAEESIKEDF